MKFCYNCGANIGENDKFCLVCGAKLELAYINSSAQHESEKTANSIQQDQNIITNIDNSTQQSQVNNDFNQVQHKQQKNNDFNQMQYGQQQNNDYNPTQYVPTQNNNYSQIQYKEQQNNNFSQIQYNQQNNNYDQQKYEQKNSIQTESKKKSKAYLWLILIVLVAVAGVGVFFVLKNKKDDSKKDKNKALVAHFGNIKITDKDDKVVIESNDIKSIMPQTIENAAGNTEYVLNIVFTSDGKDKFAEATENNIGYPMYIYVDDEIVSAPTVKNRIDGGSVIIEGVGTKEDCRKLLETLADGDVTIEDVESGKVYTKDDDSDDSGKNTTEKTNNDRTTESITDTESTEKTTNKDKTEATTEKTTEKTTDKTTETTTETITEVTTEDDKPSGGEDEYEISDKDLIKYVLRCLKGYNDSGNSGIQGISDDDLLWAVYTALCVGAQSICVQQVALDEFYGYVFNIYKFEDVCRMYNLFAKDDISVDEMQNRFEALVAKMTEGDSPKTLNICGRIYDGLLYCPIMDNTEFCGIDSIKKNPGGNTTKAEINVYYNYYSNEYGGDDWVAHFKQDGKGGMYFVSTEWVAKNDNGSGKPGNKDEVNGDVSIRDDSGNTIIDQTCIDHIDYMMDETYTEFMLDVFLNDDGKSRASSNGGFSKGQHLYVYVGNELVHDWEVTYVFSSSELVIDEIKSDSEMHELYNKLIGK